MGKHKKVSSLDQFARRTYRLSRRRCELQVMVWKLARLDKAIKEMRRLIRLDEEKLKATGKVVE